MAKAYLSLGGNIGDRIQFLAKAEQIIKKNIGEICATSGIYETEPWGFKNSSFFLNKAVLLSTNLTPDELLINTQDIEKQLGREKSRTNNYSERVIDIDILFYDDKLINQSNLIIPHPLIHNRKFVLIPLMDIAPDYIHPVFNTTIENLYKKCDDNLQIYKFEDL